MKTYIMAVLCFLALTACHSSQKSVAPANAQLLGVQPIAAFEKVPYREWYAPQYDKYLPDSETVAALRPLVADCQMTIYLGTWCGDSKREVPRMLHALKAAGMPERQIRIVALDNAAATYKQSPGHEEAGQHIFRVPTFVVRIGGAERGRIIETPVQRLEQDLLIILKRGHYQPKYAGGHYFMEHAGTAPLQFPDGLQPESKTELNSVGQVLMAAGQPEKAMLAYRTNTRLFPGEASVFSNLASASLRVKDTAAARQQVLQALRIDPKDELAIHLQTVMQE